MANPPDTSKDIRAAVRSYWLAKTSAFTKNQSGVKVDYGKRGSATAGKNMDGFLNLIEKQINKIAHPELKVFKNKSRVVLPGHFRPSKQWDMVVMFQGRFLATLELKSLGGPSFGNNANNRCEEALGSGFDFTVAQREGRLGTGANPFVGYFILVEDEESSRRPSSKGNPSIHFPNDPIFEKASYQDRMRILCERMIQEKLYSAAAVMISPESARRTGAYSNLSPETSFGKLIDKLLASLVVETKY